MAYITKNANIILLFLVVLATIFLIGATVFYQINLDRINGKYNEKLEKLHSVESELNAKIKVLNQVKQDLKLKSQREETFTQKFTEIRGEKETLEDSRVRLEKEVAELENKLENAELAKSQAINQKEAADKLLEFEQAETTKYKDLYEEEKRRRKRAESDYTTCDTALSACLSE